MQHGTFLVDVLEILMDQDPEFLKHDMEFMLGYQYINTALIKLGARKWGINKKGMTGAEVPAYQDKIMKLFEEAPWFMTSQVKNSSFHPDYDVSYMEETAFQIPDRYMMMFLKYNVAHDGFNWCEKS